MPSDENTSPSQAALCPSARVCSCQLMRCRPRNPSRCPCVEPYPFAERFGDSDPPPQDGGDHTPTAARGTQERTQQPPQGSGTAQHDQLHREDWGPKPASASTGEPGQTGSSCTSHKKPLGGLHKGSEGGLATCRPCSRSQALHHEAGCRLLEKSHSAPPRGGSHDSDSTPSACPARAQALAPWHMPPTPSSATERAH